MPEETEPEPNVEFREQLEEATAALHSTDTCPDPIIGPLVEQSIHLPEAAFKTLRERLTPTDQEALWAHHYLIKEREEIVTFLWGVLDPDAQVADDLLVAEQQMTQSTHTVLQSMAWKLVLHMQQTDAEMKTALHHLLAADPEFHKLAESVSTLLLWSNPNAANN